MWNIDLKIDFENPADTRLFYGTIWKNIIFYIYKSFLTVLLGCFQNVL